jgi:hypothetical protein
MSAVVVAPNSNKISAMNLSAEAAAAAAVVQQQCSSCLLYMAFSQYHMLTNVF